MQSIGTVLQLSVRAKRFIEHFISFRLRILCIGHDFFDADDLMALGTLAEAMTGAIHFVPWSKPTRIDQFWFGHTANYCHNLAPYGLSASAVYGNGQVRQP